MPSVIFRCNASPEIGGGHAMRCLALAYRLRDSGWTCRFGVGPGSSRVVPRLAEFDTVEVPASAEHGARLAAGGVKFDLAVVDGYGFARNYEVLLRSYARTMLVFDDLADRPHDADYLVDPTPGRVADDYGGLLPAGARLLLGPRHAPLRAEFRDAGIESDGARAGLFIALGAGATRHIVVPLVAAIARRAPDLQVDVLCPDHRPEDQVGAPPLIRWHLRDVAVAPLMRAAALAVGAGGGMAWERCATGLPTAAVLMAENQRVNLAWLAAAGAAVLLGAAATLDVETAAASVVALARDAARLERMRACARSVCDARGVSRIAVALAGNVAAKSGAAIRARLVEPEDCKMLFEWQTRPGARIHSSNPEPPVWDEHIAWFARTLADPNSTPMVIEENGMPCGHLRLDRRVERRFRVSLLIDDPFRGRGYGRAALALARRLEPAADLEAEIHDANAASLAAFAAAGYESFGEGRYLSRPTHSTVPQ